MDDKPNFRTPDMRSLECGRFWMPNRALLAQRMAPMLAWSVGAHAKTGQNSSPKRGRRKPTLAPFLLVMSGALNLRGGGDGRQA